MLRKLDFKVSDIKLREIDAAWTNAGKISRSEGVRWLINEGLQRVKQQ